MPLSIFVFFSAHRSPCCDTGCVVVSHRKSKDGLHLQWMLMPPLEVMSALWSKLVTWGSGNPRLPHLLLGATAAQDSVTQEGGLPPQDRWEAGQSQLLYTLQMLGKLWEGSSHRWRALVFSSLPNCLVPFSSGRTLHANHLWVDHGVK